MAVNQNKCFYITIMFVIIGHDFTISRPNDYEQDSALWLHSPTNHIFPDNAITEIYKTSTAALLACTLALILVVIGVLIFMYLLSVRNACRYSQARVQSTFQERLVVPGGLFSEPEDLTPFYDLPPSYESVMKLTQLVPPPPSYDDECVIKLPAHFPKVRRPTDGTVPGSILQSSSSVQETKRAQNFFAEDVSRTLSEGNYDVISYQRDDASEHSNPPVLNQQQLFTSFINHTSFLRCLTIPSFKQTNPEHDSAGSLQPLKIPVSLTTPHLANFSQNYNAKTKADQSLKLAPDGMTCISTQMIPKCSHFRGPKNTPKEQSLTHSSNPFSQVNMIHYSDMSQTAMNSQEFSVLVAGSNMCISNRSNTLKIGSHKDSGTRRYKDVEKCLQGTHADRPLLKNLPLTAFENITTICTCVGACACAVVLSKYFQKPQPPYVNNSTEHPSYRCTRKPFSKLNRRLSLPDLNGLRHSVSEKPHSHSDLCFLYVMSHLY